VPLILGERRRSRGFEDSDSDLGLGLDFDLGFDFDFGNMHEIGLTLPPQLRRLCQM